MGVKVEPRWDDNTQAREMNPNRDYARVKPEPDSQKANQCLQFFRAPLPAQSLQTNSWNASPNVPVTTKQIGFGPVRSQQENRTSVQPYKLAVPALERDSTTVSGSKEPTTWADLLKDTDKVKQG